MRHEQALALIEKQYEDGPLPPHQAKALRIHLSRCAECRASYDRHTDLECLVGGDGVVAQAQIERLVDLGPPEPESAARRRLTWLRVATPLTLAAGIAAAVLALQPAPPLPSYEMTVHGGLKRLRSDEEASEVVRYRPGSRLQLVLRPEVPVGGDVVVEALLSDGQGLRPWPVTVERSAQGALRVQPVQARETPGRYRLLVVVARTGELPPPSAIVPEGGPGYQVFERRLDILSGP